MPVAPQPKERRLRGRPVWWIAAGLGALLVILLALTQVLLPRVAERRIRSAMADAGVPAHVKVRAFPAVKLLFGRIDSAAVRAGRGQASPSDVAGLLAETDDIDRLDVSAPYLEVSGVGLHQAMLRKRGDRLTASVTTTRPDIVSLLPPGSQLGALRSRPGGIEIDGSLTALGTRLSGPALLRPRAGSLVLETPDLPLVGSQTLTAFSDPRVKFDRVSERSSGQDVRFLAAGHLTRRRSPGGE